MNVSRQCTCHPDDNPPTPCEHHYAFRDCADAAEERYLRETLAILREHALTEEIKRLNYELTRWKARAQLLQRWLCLAMATQDCSSLDEVWESVIWQHPEAEGWFGSDGGPKAALRGEQESAQALVLSESPATMEAREIDEWRDLENLLAAGIHTCHPNCPRYLCKMRRRIKELEATAAP